MEEKDYNTALSLKKLDFIRKIISETSLDTLSAWMNMYDEARYVAAMDSDEEELKVELAEKKRAFKLMNE